MKLKNSQIINIFQAIAKLDPTLNKDNPNAPKTSYQFKGKVTYALARNYRTLRAIVEDIDNTRVQLINKLREPNEDRLAGESLEKFNKEWIDILNESTEVERIHVIKIEDLELEKNQISPVVLAELLDVIAEGEIV